MSLPAVAPPPTNSQVVGDTSLFTSPWQLWLTALWNAVRGPANTQAPKASNANGIAGQLAYDTNYLYVCLGANQWKRVPLQNF
jgi:hypothetical protein